MYLQHVFKYLQQLKYTIGSGNSISQQPKGGQAGECTLTTLHYLNMFKECYPRRSHAKKSTVSNTFINL